jgi:hypothetical protein
MLRGSKMMLADHWIGMSMAPRKIAMLMGALALTGLASLPAAATTTVLTGSGQMDWTGQFLGSSTGNTQTTPTAPFGNDYSLSVPGQYSFLDSFGKQSNALTGTRSSVGPYAFQDTYEFSLGQAASGDALTVSLNLGQGPSATFDISDLQFRLYAVPSGSTPGLSIPGGGMIVTPWMGTPGASSGNPIQASFSDLQAGTYFLDVAGTADGANGGTYVGQLNLNAVPLPGALWLLLSGLGLFGLATRRVRL